ncbi:MAG: nucleotidyltransferase domain-containing protein [Clostridia bacterium]|nr:nucleotidyltransferase domain-containing protein [Clostridia bacterium]
MDKLSKLPYSFKDDIQKAIKILKENGAEEVFIFGSIANGKFNENSDIDIAIKGLEKKDFYRVASILMFELENQFDLIDLDDKENRFSQMLLSVGGLLKVG